MSGVKGSMLSCEGPRAGADPWSRARRVYVQKEERGWRLWLIDEEGYVMYGDEVPLARLAVQD